MQAKKTMGKNSNNLVGVTGEYYVCAELGKMGILALLTPKNNPLFDIVAVCPSTLKTVLIQVKTMSEENNQGWKLGMDICIRKNNENLFVLLVNVKTNSTDYYTFKYDDLSERVENLYLEYLNTPKRNGENRKDIGFRWLDLKQLSDEEKSRKNKWELLGFNQNEMATL
jgi:hypothetical protein